MYIYLYFSKVVNEGRGCIFMRHISMWVVKLCKTKQRKPVPSPHPGWRNARHDDLYYTLGEGHDYGYLHINIYVYLVGQGERGKNCEHC